MKTKAQERYGNTSGIKKHVRILKFQNNPELNFRNPDLKSGILIFHICIYA
jgi:hypothetical protein